MTARLASKTGRDLDMQWNEEMKRPRDNRQMFLRGSKPSLLGWMLLALGCKDSEVMENPMGESTETTREAPPPTRSEDEGSASDGGKASTGEVLNEATSEGTLETSATENLPTEVVDDAYLVRQGEALTIDAANGNGVLQNDRGAMGERLAAVEQTMTSVESGATIRFFGDGSLEYLPASTPIWWGEDSFVYTAINALGETGTANVRIVVSPTAIPLERIAAGVGGFAIDGDATDEYRGRVVSGAGDVNGDGYADLLVGADEADPNDAENSGRTYVVFGGTREPEVSLSRIAQGVGGFVINGETAGDGSGRSVSGADDVNGDGYPDLIIGSSVAEPGGASGSGRIYVVFGGVVDSPVLLANVAEGIGGFAILGEGFNDFLGRSVSGTGDVNGDGYADLLVGASGANPNDASDSGRSYVVFGGASESPVSLASIAEGLGGFAIDGEAATDSSGLSVSGAGDVNGDGYADLLVGAPGAANGASFSGKSYVVFGGFLESPVSLASVAAGTGGFAINGESAGDVSGLSVSGAGDVNGDGYADLLVGARDADPNGASRSGRSYVVFGGAVESPVSLVSIAVGEGGFVIDGEVADDLSGCSVSGAGDVNGDGYADLLIGAYRADPNGAASSGRSYLVFGGDLDSPVSLTSIANGIGGFAMDGEATDVESESGASVSGAGDVNGDGYTDLFVGGSGGGTSYIRRGYVIFGGDFTLSATPPNQSPRGTQSPLEVLP